MELEKYIANQIRSLNFVRSLGCLFSSEKKVEAALTDSEVVRALYTYIQHAAAAVVVEAELTASTFCTRSPQQLYRKPKLVLSNNVSLSVCLLVCPSVRSKNIVPSEGASW